MTIIGNTSKALTSHMVHVHLSLLETNVPKKKFDLIF